MKTKIRSFIIILITILGFQSNYPLLSQTNIRACYLQLDAGGYSTFTGGGTGSSAGISASLLLNSHMFSVDCNLGVESDSYRAFRSFDALYGLYYEIPDVRFHGQIGAGLLQYRNLYTFQNTFGVPVRLGVNLTTLRWTGIGFDLIFHVNSEMSFGEMVLTLQLGKLR